MEISNLYDEFGDAWASEFMKLEKGTIISLLRNVCMDRIMLDERLETATQTLKDLDAAMDIKGVEKGSPYHNGIKKILIDLRVIAGRRVEGTEEKAYEAGKKLCLESRRDVYIKHIQFGPGMDKDEFQLLFETDVFDPEPKDFFKIIYYLDVDRV